MLCADEANHNLIDRCAVTGPSTLFRHQRCWNKVLDEVSIAIHDDKNHYEPNNYVVFSVEFQ